MTDKLPIKDAPAEALLAHRRRTAAVARLVAHHLFLPSEEKDLLRAACLLHDHSASLLAPESLERTLEDMLGEDAHALVVHDDVPGTVHGILEAYHAPGRGTARDSKLAGILRLADAFDRHMTHGNEIGGILERLRDGVETGHWTEESIDALVDSTNPLPIGPADSWPVPVFPTAALHMLNQMRNPRASLAGIVEAAGKDPATAGLLMQLANSALFGAREPVTTLSKAIVRLGFATSQKVLTLAALRPLFSSPKLQSAWQHSLEVADLLEQLAGRAGSIDPAEAYLAGLVHDVGRIALLAVPLYDSARLEGLVYGGCPQVYAENLLLRTDHASVGGEIAAGWLLPETMVSAIRHHHRPEKAGSPLADLLYVAEHLSGAGEDLPHAGRLESSLNGIGLTWEEVCDCSVSALGNWLAAA